MHDLNRPASTFGDKSTAWLTLLEKHVGAPILAKTGHTITAAESIPGLRKMAAHTDKLPDEAIQRLLREARKMEDALAWNGKIDDLPGWVDRAKFTSEIARARQVADETAARAAKNAARDARRAERRARKKGISNDQR